MLSFFSNQRNANMRSQWGFISLAQDGKKNFFGQWHTVKEDAEQWELPSASDAGLNVHHCLGIQIA